MGTDYYCGDYSREFGTVRVVLLPLNIMRISDERLAELTSASQAFVDKYESAWKAGNTWPPPQLEDALVLDLLDARQQLKIAKDALELYAGPALYEQVAAHDSMGRCCAIDRGLLARKALEALKD
jgi:hypothetical protein